MASPVTIVCTTELATGFQLAGVNVNVVDEPAAAEKAIRELSRSARHGLIIVDERLWEPLPERLREEALAASTPFFAVIPLVPKTVDGTLEETVRNDVRELMQQAVGLNIVGN